MFYILAFFVFTLTHAYGGEQHVTIGQDPATTVFPIIIDEPGSYLLVTDLYLDDPTPHAILIISDSVSLNLGGHTISNHPYAGNNLGYGIAAFDRKNISIRNGIITNRSHGICLVRGSGHIIEDVTACYNKGTGITTPQDSIIRNCISCNNTYGITARKSLVKGCTVNNNAFNGITAEYKSLIHSCIAIGNSPDILRCGSGNMVHECLYIKINDYPWKVP